MPVIFQSQLCIHGDVCIHKDAHHISASCGAFDLWNGAGPPPYHPGISKAATCAAGLDRKSAARDSLDNGAPCVRHQPADPAV